MQNHSKMKDVIRSTLNLIIDAIVDGLDSGKILVLQWTFTRIVGLFNSDRSDKEFPDAKIADLIARENVLQHHTAFYTTKAVYDGYAINGCLISLY